MYNSRKYNYRSGERGNPAAPRRNSRRISIWSLLLLAAAAAPVIQYVIANSR